MSFHVLPMLAEFSWRSSVEMGDVFVPINRTRWAIYNRKVYWHEVSKSAIDINGSLAFGDTTLALANLRRCFNDLYWPCNFSILIQDQMTPQIFGGSNTSETLPRLKTSEYHFNVAHLWEVSPRRVDHRRGQQDCGRGRVAKFLTVFFFSPVHAARYSK